MKQADFIIVAVPTPIDKHNKPDLFPLLKASETVGKVITPDTIVVYESTVYPGATEEDCVPVLEKYSDLVCGKDFLLVIHLRELIQETKYILLKRLQKLYQVKRQKY